MRLAEADAAREMKRYIRSLAVAGFAAMNIMLLSVSVWAGNASDITPATRDFFHWFSALIALPAAAYAGQPFFESAWRALKGRRVNMDVPISLGVLLALGVSLYETIISARDVYFDSAVMLLFFLLAGRALDLAMRRKTRALAGNIAALKAETADRIAADGTVRTVPAGAIEVGDTILVRPGARVAADGRVVSGIVGGRPEPGDRRDGAEGGRGRRSGLCRLDQPGRHADRRGDGAGRRLAHRRGAEAARQGDRGALQAPAGSPTGRRRSMPRRCISPRLSRPSAGSSPVPASIRRSSWRPRC